MHYSTFVRQFILIVAALTVPITAQAGLIRDAEIEHTLRAYAQPILEAADIPTRDVRIFIIANPTINAYVAGGLNIFLHTGLIRNTKNPGMLIGVLAHETGHISGAHLSQFTEKSNRALIGSLLGAAISAAVIGGAIATQGRVGRDAGQASIGAIAGTQSMIQRQILGDIRLNEQSADHAALAFLDANAISATGMLEMFEALRRQESGGTSKDPFLLTHPLTTDRIATIRNHVAQSNIPADQVPEEFRAMHARMLAKLVAFTEPYETTLTLYPASDTSVAARYARAIAEFKRSHLTEALAGMNALIKSNPKDPFFYDTKGQILFENGKVVEAAAAYAKAHSLMPDSALILTDYAKTLIAQEDSTLLPRAITLLEQSRDLDDSYDLTWRQLALAYGKQGKLGLSYKALAEEAVLGGDYETALQHLARARELAGDDPALILQIDDLDRDVKAQWKEKKEGSLF